MEGLELAYYVRGVRYFLSPIATDARGVCYFLSSVATLIRGLYINFHLPLQPMSMCASHTVLIKLVIV